MTDEKKIALIFFSRNAKAESKDKQWLNGNDELNRHLASNIIDHASASVRESGFPVFHFHEGNQEGKTFGERFANAYREVFDLGYESVVSVGNDIPDLSNTAWDEVALQLNAGKAVVGKTKRGGAYLIGFSRVQFDYEGFRALPWQKSNLFDSLLNHFTNRSTKTALLSTLRDLNSFHDLIHFMKDLKGKSSLKPVLKALLTCPTSINRFCSIEVPKFQLAFSKILRAPPSQNSLLA